MSDDFPIFLGEVMFGFPVTEIYRRQYDNRLNDQSKEYPGNRTAVQLVRHRKAPGERHGYQFYIEVTVPRQNSVGLVSHSFLLVRAFSSV
jgi:hypothetical protein